jgi:hypothetical protein
VPVQEAQDRLESSVQIGHPHPPALSGRPRLG